MKMLWRFSLKIFSTLRIATSWLSERMLDCQVYCSNKIGDAPF